MSHEVAAQAATMSFPKAEMMRTLHEQHDFSDRFIAHMLARNIRVEEDLVDQLFNSSDSGSPARCCCSRGTARRTTTRIHRVQRRPQDQ
jgi:hypothetical protein